MGAQYGNGFFMYGLAEPPKLAKAFIERKIVLEGVVGGWWMDGESGQIVELERDETLAAYDKWVINIESESWQREAVLGREYLSRLFSADRIRSEAMKFVEERDDLPDEAVGAITDFVATRLGNLNMGCTILHIG